MPTPLYTPRVNNNDDLVKLINLAASDGDYVKAGQVVASVETDKAIVDVEIEQDGYVLKVLAQLEDVIPVGSVLLWVGATMNETVPDSKAEPTVASQHNGDSKQPTARARILLRKYGVEASQVPIIGERLTAEDVMAWASKRELADHSGENVKMAKKAERRPIAEGKPVEFTSEQHGMQNAVAWQRDHAATGYIELAYDPKPLDDWAQAFQDQNKLLFSPLLSLMLWRLAQMAEENPKLNSTVYQDKFYQYDSVNTGFTVQAGETLYVAVLRDAGKLDALEFVNRMTDLQRRAMVKKLKPTELEGATISFSSMARWNITRHVPILSPGTSLMVAHAATINDQAVVGATYDHRVLSGFDVAMVLRQLVSVPETK